MEKIRYIGDGVYAEYDRIGIKLSTQRYDDGNWVIHYIYLEPKVFNELVEFMSRVKNE